MFFSSLDESCVLSELSWGVLKSVTGPGVEDFLVMLEFLNIEKF